MGRCWGIKIQSAILLAPIMAAQPFDFVPVSDDFFAVFIASDSFAFTLRNRLFRKFLGGLCAVIKN